MAGQIIPERSCWGSGLGLACLLDQAPGTSGTSLLWYIYDSGSLLWLEGCREMVLSGKLWGGSQVPGGRLALEVRISRKCSFNLNK